MVLMGFRRCGCDVVVEEGEEETEDKERREVWRGDLAF